MPAGWRPLVVFIGGRPRGLLAGTVRLAGDEGVSRVEVRGEPWVPRSRGHEETFAADLTDRAEVRAATARLARRVTTDVAAEGRPVARVVVTLRFAPFTTRTHGVTLPGPTTDAEVIEAAALELLDRFTRERPVRLVGVRAEFARP